MCQQIHNAQKINAFLNTDRHTNQQPNIKNKKKKSTQIAEPRVNERVSCVYA